MTTLGQRLREGWWVAAAALLLAVAAAAAVLTGAFGGSPQGVRQPHNGFDLSRALVPADEIVDSGLPRDGLEALDHPAMLTATEAAGTRLGAHGTLLVPDDRVVGIDIDGDARAYPLRLMVWHEVVNDTVGGVPVAVTYNALCDSAAVLRRRTPAGELTFGVSGLLYQSNLLLYDVREGPAASSLWSQLQARAVTGPASTSGARLRRLDAAVVRWADWQALHPDTTVLAPRPELIEAYRRDTYGSYFGSDLLRFPVDPLPPPSELRHKDPVVMVEVDGRKALFALTRVARAEGRERGAWDTRIGGVPVRLHYGLEPATARVEVLDDQTHAVSVVTSFWFAWYATHPDAPEPGP